MRTRAAPPTSRRENRHSARNTNAMKDLQYSLHLKKKSEKEKQNNKYVWSDDEKDNRATCKTKACTNKLPNNSDNSLCNTCLFVRMRPQPEVERKISMSERLRYHRKVAYDRETEVLKKKIDDKQVNHDDEESSLGKKGNKESKDKNTDDEEVSEECEDDNDEDDDEESSLKNDHEESSLKKKT